jgi:hypothetical protein
MNGVRGWMVMTKVFKFDGLSVETPVMDRMVLKHLMKNE